MEGLRAQRNAVTNRVATDLGIDRWVRKASTEHAKAAGNTALPIQAAAGRNPTLYLPLQDDLGNFYYMAGYDPIGKKPLGVS